MLLSINPLHPQPRRIQQVVDILPNDGIIILSCYNMDKEANKYTNSITSTLNQNHSFRINIRSRLFENYLKKKE